MSDTKGIVFMLMAALCFSMMGGAAKALKKSSRWSACSLS
jgi:hypothetical protein